MERAHGVEQQGIDWALSFLLSRLLQLTAIEFFGDFKELEPTAKADSAHSAFEELMRLLGGESQPKKRNESLSTSEGGLDQVPR